MDQSESNRSGGWKMEYTAITIMSKMKREIDTGYSGRAIMIQKDRYNGTCMGIVHKL